MNANLQTVLSGLQSVDDLKQRVAQQAKSLYGANPDLARALDNGETVTGYMQPYADYAANLLEINPGDIDWLDPKWNKALTGAVDPKTGQTTGMSLSQWAQTLRTDPTYDYDSTDGAMAVAHDLTNKIAQAFGYRAA